MIILTLFFMFFMTCGIDSILFLYPPEDIDDVNIIINQLDGVKHPGEENALVWDSIRGYDVFYSLFEATNPPDDDFLDVLTVTAVRAAASTDSYPIVSGSTGHEYYRLFKGETEPVLPFDEFYKITTALRRAETYRIIFNADTDTFFENETSANSLIPTTGTEKKMKRYVDRYGTRTYLDFTDISSLSDQDYINSGITGDPFYAYVYVFVWGIDDGNLTKLYSEEPVRIGPFQISSSG